MGPATPQPTLDRLRQTLSGIDPSLAPKLGCEERLIGIAEDWSCLDEFLLQYVVDPSQKATVFASSFAAALEMVREGAMELNQKQAFAPLYFRKRPPQAATAAAPDLSVE